MPVRRRLLDLLQCLVREYRRAHIRERAHIVIKPLQGEGMQVNEIARHMHGDKVPLAIARVHVPRHEAIDEQQADVDRRVLVHRDLTCPKCPNAGDGRLQPVALGIGQRGGAVQEDGIGQHRLGEGAIVRHVGGHCINPDQD